MVSPVRDFPDGTVVFILSVCGVVIIHNGDGEAVLMFDGLAAQRVRREPRGNISALIRGTDETPAEILSSDDFGLRGI